MRIFDPASSSFASLERRQYLTEPRPIILAISGMVQKHFRDYLGLTEESVRVLHASIDPERFAAEDRPERRDRERKAWGVSPDEVGGLFVGMNYRLKGLAPLLRSLAHVPAATRFKLVMWRRPSTQDTNRSRSRCECRIA